MLRGESGYAYQGSSRTISKKIQVPNQIASDACLSGVLERVDESFRNLVKTKRLFPLPLLVCSGGTTSRCAAEGHWTLDLRKNYKEMVFDDEKKEIYLGAGNNMGDLVKELAKYKRSFPIGLSKLTGIGYIINGGVSPLSRSQGLAVDQIVEFKGVWGNGEYLNLKKPVSSSSLTEKKIWGALCGAAPFLAIITHLKIKTFELERIDLWQSIINKNELIEAIQHAESSPDTYSFQWFWGENIIGFGINSSVINEKVLFHESILKDLSFKKKIKLSQVSGLNELPSFNITSSKNQHADIIYSEVISLIGKSWGEDSECMVKLIEKLIQDRPHKSCSIAAQQMGGVINKNTAPLTSFIHRSGSWKIWITACWPQADERMRTKSLKWLEIAWDELMKRCSGVHMAQMHPHLTWHEREIKLAFKNWLPELRELKAKYDPEELLPKL